MAGSTIVTPSRMCCAHRRAFISLAGEGEFGTIVDAETSAWSSHNAGRTCLPLRTKCSTVSVR